MSKKRLISLALCFTLALSAFALPAGAEGAKYTTETTKDGWIRVINDGGATLGYSPDSGVTLLEDDGFAFKDLNKNGALDPYEDWRLSDDERAVDLAARLDQDFIVGLMWMPFDGGDEIAAMLGLSSEPNTIENTGSRILGMKSGATAKDTIANSNATQAQYEATAEGIPAVLDGRSSSKAGFPYQLGLGATFDAEVVAQAGHSMAQELRAVGATTSEWPQIDLITEPRWRRTQSCFTEDPKLGMDLASAFTNAFQSTYDEEGNDLGWGSESVLAILKHFPGDGSAESGREAHNAFGKYNVYPGDNFYTSALPFKACLELEGLTGYAAMVMPSYSIATDENGESYSGERVGSGYSYFKVTELLYEEMEYKGVTFTDYQIGTLRPWGMEDKTLPERFLLMIEAGNDVVTSENDYDSWYEGHQLYKEKHGEEAYDARIRLSAEKILKMIFQIEAFENPYVETEAALEVLNDKEMQALAFEAQKKSVVMLKNAGNLIQQRDDKPTVYVPMVYKAAAGANLYTGNYGAGFGDKLSLTDTGASAELPIDIRVLSKYFNVVTDSLAETYTGPAGADGKPTLAKEDIIRASAEEIAACDFAFVIISDPSNASGGYNAETDEYIPISLQYRPYTADSVYVRQTSIAGDLKEVEVQSDYGAQTVISQENRSYYGKTSDVTNESELDFVLEIAELTDNLIVIVESDGAMIFNEFESAVEGILLSLGGVSDEAFCEILAGKFDPYGLLPIQMPANMETVEMQYEDVPRDMECHVDSEGNAYDFTFGMNWAGVIQDERVTKYNVAPLEF